MFAGLRLFFFCLCITISCAIGMTLYFFNTITVDFSCLTEQNIGQPSILLDDEGNEWARFALDRRDPIVIDELPKHVCDAFIAAEDWQFFNHRGISFKGIIRSFLVNLWYGRIVQGASTITQQLVKLLFFDGQRTFKRKIKEQLYAILAEHQCTKEQILQTYLNHVYFGCGIYGVEAASQRFWGKHVTQISIDEAATLAAIVRSPANYCPIMAPLSAQQRRDVVLRSMKKLQMITEQEYGQAIATPLLIKDIDNQKIATHAKEYIRLLLEEELGKRLLYTGGLTIQTTLNRTLQELAEKSFYDNMRTFKKELIPEMDGALITLESKTGAIKAAVGGFDFNSSKFNRVWHSKRQIGSVFKPLVYAAAVQAGASFADTEIDEPIALKQGAQVWQPNNYNKKFAGQTTLAHALTHSNNIVSLKTLLKYGAQPVLLLAQRCHLEGAQYAYPSLALGCVDACLKEVAGMFNIFANDGIYVQPHIISWAKDSWGTKIWKHQLTQEHIVPKSIAHKVAKVLENGIKRWRRVYQKEFIEENVIIKTGSTNDCRTCWFAGSTPELTTVVYVGCDDNRAMGDIYPVRTAFPIWLDLHAKLKLTGKNFTYDPLLKPIWVDQWTGAWSHPTNPDAVEIFA